MVVRSHGSPTLADWRFCGSCHFACGKQLLQRRFVAFYVSECHSANVSCTPLLWFQSALAATFPLLHNAKMTWHIYYFPYCMCVCGCVRVGACVAKFRQALCLLQVASELLLEVALGRWRCCISFHLGVHLQFAMFFYFSLVVALFFLFLFLVFALRLHATCNLAHLPICKLSRCVKRRASFACV